MKDFLNQRVQDVEKDLGKKINQHEIKFMLQVLPYLLLSCRNTVLNKEEQKDLQREFTLIRKRIEYRASQNLNCTLSKTFGFSLNDIEISLLAVLLLSYRKDCILSKNPLTSQIKGKYPDLFAVTKSCSDILEEAWLISLTDDELAFISVHMGGFLKQRHVDTKDTKRIYIVCDEGVAIQRLLLKQCTYHLPNENIGAVFTTEQFKSVEDILNADLLITTNDGLETTLPMVVISPILDYEDILNITSVVKNQTLFTKGVRFTRDLELLLSQYVRDSARIQDLKHKVQKLVNEELLSTLNDK